MRIESLRLFQFRNLKNGTIEFPPGVCCLVGENGQGKTNLIEAISLLSLARSFRTASLSELIAWGQSSCSVFATAQIRGEPTEVGVAIENKNRVAFVNGKEAASLTVLFSLLSSVTFSPTDIDLIKGSPAGRRRFIDRHVVDFDPPIVATYVDYQKALRSKTALLKTGSQDRDAYHAWNKLLAPLSLAILNGRNALKAELERRLVPIGERLFADPRAISLSFRGGTHHLFDEAEEGKEVSEGEMYELLDRHLEREIAQQRTAVGPHRDDLNIKLFGKDARAYASQGQSRSLVLALKLAVIQMFEEARGEAPVVLLDDVDSELDAARRKAIFEMILGAGRQVFITATEYRLPEEVRAQVSSVLSISGGEVSS